MTQGSGTKPRVGIIVAVVLVVVIAVVWTAVLLHNRSSSGAASQNYTASIVGGTVVAGRPAKNTVDVYEDFLCSYCARFEARDGDRISRAIDNGQIQVVYHPLAVLSLKTTPIGYSLRAANAALCAAAGGFFPEYHATLFASQPAEGSAGLRNDQLVGIAQQLGKANPAFTSCVTTGKYNQTVTQETLKASKNVTLRPPGKKPGLYTPTVVVNGKWTDMSDESWLTGLTGDSS